MLRSKLGIAHHSLVLNDAIEGHLQTYVEHQGQVRYEVWIDEHKGILRKRVNDPSVRATARPASG